MLESKCEICGHFESQHLTIPMACADCMREDRDNAFHSFIPAAAPTETAPTQEVEE